MQPEPAVVTELDRMLDRQRLGAAVAVEPECPHQAGNARHGIRYRADKLRRLSHDQPQPSTNAPLRKMADGIVRTLAGTQLRHCYSLMMMPYSAASAVEAAASA